MKYWIGFAAILVGCIVGAQFFTIFVIQTIGAIPEGRTLIITRLTNMNFIDSADGMCERKLGGVSLMCRLAALAQVTKESTIIGRLPYSGALYGISTGLKKYDR